MVLRSGTIIPFQFRDIKKLLMIGGPEEQRELSIWDLRNVVRAAFGVYQFEFRNKKIGFNIPDEMLITYLAQRHDLSNFVIEIGTVNDVAKDKESLSFEPSCSQKLHVPLPQASNDSGTNDVPLQSYSPAMQQQQSVKIALVDTTNSSSNHSSNPDQIQKMRISELSIELNPMDIIPKSEQVESDNDGRDGKYAVADAMQQQHQAQQLHQSHQMHQHIQQHALAVQHHTQQHTHHPPPQQHLDEQQSQSSAQSSPPPSLAQVAQQHQQFVASPFFPSYGHGIITNPSHSASPPPHQYSPTLVNRFRRRGERMSKDQKELYVKYFEENPCMLTQRRNDAMLEPHWKKLASLLNSVPQGAAKNVEEWKQTFDAWRYRVFMYTRYNSKLTGAAAQNPKMYKPLTSTDQRAYTMWTSHKSTTPHDFEKMDIFPGLDDTQADYDY